MIFRPDLVLIDGSSYIYRAFHALPPLTTTKGKPTGATRGFASMLRKLISTYPNVPMVMIFDAKGPNFRNDFYKEYKANRPPMPNELRVQIDDIKKLSKDELVNLAKLLEIVFYRGRFRMKVDDATKNNLINKITIEKKNKPLDTPQKALTIQSDEILDLFGTQK